MPEMGRQDLRIAVVIPCYRVAGLVLGVLGKIGPEVWRIYCVDDACPENSGGIIEDGCTDPRVRVLRHEQNQGVGGAMITGYRAALADGAEIVVKIDGDGQMDPALLPRFVAPIAAGEADYAKGNRFYRLETLSGMPWVRLAGNAALSFITKASSGYWDLFDPTNGYTAVHAAALREIPLDKLARRYFFETDMLFRLNTLGAVAVDVPMEAHYGEEQSSLRVGSVLWPFLIGNLRNFCKRFFYTYVLRDFNAATIQTLLGLILLIFGSFYGGAKWIASLQTGIPTPAGTVMVAALPVIFGLQLLLAALQYDLGAMPKRPLHRRLRGAASNPQEEREKSNA